RLLSLNSTLSEKISGFFQPQLPSWACEFTAQHVVVAGVDGRRTHISGAASVGLPVGTVTASLTERNIPDKPRLQSLVKETLRSASFKGSEVSVVIPDESTRISFVNAETLPKTLEEQQSFLRWKLKKTVPFDVDTAQIAFRVVGQITSGSHKARGVD